MDSICSPKKEHFYHGLMMAFGFLLGTFYCSHFFSLTFQLRKPVLKTRFYQAPFYRGWSLLNEVLLGPHSIQLIYQITEWLYAKALTRDKYD